MRDNLTEIKAPKRQATSEFAGQQHVWTEQGPVYRLTNNNTRVGRLENAIYMLGADLEGFFLFKMDHKFTFDYKLYGIETEFIDRVCRTYSATKTNLGVLLNGVKGTGKTVTAKTICNKIGLPVILVPKHFEHGHIFLNGIPQDIVIFIDEYEKVFEDKSSDMLTIMDGALNSSFKRIFVLTTNNLYVSENLLQRPSRIRYLKEFKDLHPTVIEEVIDDKLKYPKFKKDVMEFVTCLEIITIDIVKAIIEEVNIHNESPQNFKDVFNVKKLTGKFNVYVLDEKNKTQTELARGARLYPGRFNVPDDDIVGRRLDVNGDAIGTIEKVVGYNTFLIKPIELKEKKKKTISNGVETIISIVPDLISPKEKPQEKEKNKIKKLPFVIRIEDADIMNHIYQHGKYAIDQDYGTMI